jgi:hypothetical protein
MPGSLVDLGGPAREDPIRRILDCCREAHKGLHLVDREFSDVYLGMHARQLSLNGSELIEYGFHG